MIEGFEPLAPERVGLHGAVGRILAEAITAPESVPHFNRALMDGFAVRARDTFGASESQPALLRDGGEVKMGEACVPEGLPGNAIAIPTGAMVPAGTDSVVMIEYTSRLDSESIEVMKPVAPGENILLAGEDIQAGQPVFSTGHFLRPQDIGVLAVLGIDSVKVYCKPRVAILSTGDEIVPVSTIALPPGKIRDINSYTLAAQVLEVGAITGTIEVVGDDLDCLVAACRRALADHDVILISGGSSVGVRDLTVLALDSLAEADLLVHGVAVRPGKPTILARAGRKILWGLPGHPISAMTICRTFVLPCLYSLQGLKGKPAWKDAGAERAVLTRKLPSVHGRTDYVPVVLRETPEGLAATPVFGKSAMIGALARSDGYIVIDRHVEGLDAGAEVRVHLFHANLGR